MFEKCEAYSHNTGAEPPTKPFSSPVASMEWLKSRHFASFFDEAFYASVFSAFWLAADTRARSNKFSPTSSDNADKPTWKPSSRRNDEEPERFRFIINAGVSIGSGLGRQHSTPGCTKEDLVNSLRREIILLNAILLDPRNQSIQRLLLSSHHSAQPDKGRLIEYFKNPKIFVGDVIYSVALPSDSETSNTNYFEVLRKIFKYQSSDLQMQLSIAGIFLGSVVGREQDGKVLSGALSRRLAKHLNDNLRALNLAEDRLPNFIINSHYPKEYICVIPKPARCVKETYDPFVKAFYLGAHLHLTHQQLSEKKNAMTQFLKRFGVQ